MTKIVRSSSSPKSTDAKSGRACQKIPIPVVDRSRQASDSCSKNGILVGVFQIATNCAWAYGCRFERRLSPVERALWTSVACSRSESIELQPTLVGNTDATLACEAAGRD